MTLKDKLIILYWAGVLAYTIYVYVPARDRHAHRPIPLVVACSMMVGALWPIDAPWGKYHVARDIWKLAEQPEGTFRNVGPKSGRRSMSQSEAKRAVDAAVALKLVDSGG